MSIVSLVSEVCQLAKTVYAKLNTKELDSITTKTPLLPDNVPRVLKIGNTSNISGIEINTDIGNGTQTYLFRWKDPTNFKHLRDPNYTEIFINGIGEISINGLGKKVDLTVNQFDHIVRIIQRELRDENALKEFNQVLNKLKSHCKD